MKLILPILLVILSTVHLQSQRQDERVPLYTPYLHSKWSDSVLNSLSDEEKIGQLIWVSVEKSTVSIAKTIEAVQQHNVGGLIYQPTEMDDLLSSIQFFQDKTKLPLITSIEAESGLNFTDRESLSLPHAITLGALSHDSLIYHSARLIALQLKTFGLNANFAPVADIYTKDKTMLGVRSFGSNGVRVAKKTEAFVDGLQAERTLSILKYFPQKNVFTSPPAPINPQLKDVTEAQILPYRTAIDKGIMSVLAPDARQRTLPYDTLHSLPRTIVERLLIKTLGFEGLVLTNPVPYRASTIADQYETQAYALALGYDIITQPSDLNKIFQEINSMLEAGVLSWEEIDAKCRKVLAVKQWLGLHKTDTNQRKLQEADLSQKRLDDPEWEWLVHQIYRNAVTVLNNQDNLLPFQRLDKKKITLLVVGDNPLVEFVEMVKKYTQITALHISSNISKTEQQQVIHTLEQSTHVVIATSSLSLLEEHIGQSANGSGDLSPVEALMQKLFSEQNTLVHFGHPQELERLQQLKQLGAVVLGYENKPIAQQTVAQVLFGGIPATGKLPVDIGTLYREGDGVATHAIQRLTYAPPYSVDINEERLDSAIQSIMQFALDTSVFPGCNILVAKNNAVIFHKAFGYHTYDKRVASRYDDIYDLASVTKVMASTLALMKMTQDSLLLLDAPFSDLWTNWKKYKNKKYLTARQILSHQAGLKPYINYFKSTVKDEDVLQRKSYHVEETERYDLEIISGMYLNGKFKKKIFKTVDQSPVSRWKKYRYSGLSFMLYPDIVYQQTGEYFESYLKKNFYHKLGAYELTYLPTRYFSIHRIPPTEYDTTWRKRLVRGFVHDESAASMGGISGNAGLFGSANDLAKLAQMFLNKGAYGGEQLLTPSVVEEFTRVQYPQNKNRRGLGFDKPSLPDQDPYPIEGVSPESYGHSGFTGTFVWIDPTYDLTFIFLSNSVYPNRKFRQKLYKLEIREQLLRTIYHEVNSSTKEMTDLP